MSINDQNYKISPQDSFEYNTGYFPAGVSAGAIGGSGGSCSIAFNAVAMQANSSMNIAAGAAFGGNGGVVGNNGNCQLNFTANAYSPGKSVFDSPVEFTNDVIINGMNVTQVLDTITSRLAVLIPDPKKLAHYEALQRAYAHYKLLESLVDAPSETNDD